MKARMRYLIAAIILTIVGAIYTFVPPDTLMDWGIAFLRHNDRVLIGILCLLTAIVFLYRVIKN